MANFKKELDASKGFLNDAYFVDALKLGTLIGFTAIFYEYAKMQMPILDGLAKLAETAQDIANAPKNITQGAKANIADGLIASSPIIATVDTVNEMRKDKKIDYEKALTALSPAYLAYSKLKDWSGWR